MKKCHVDYRWASEIFHPTYEGNEIFLFGLIYFTENMIYTAPGFRYKVPLFNDSDLKELGKI